MGPHDNRRILHRTLLLPALWAVGCASGGASGATGPWTHGGGDQGTTTAATGTSTEGATTQASGTSAGTAAGSSAGSGTVGTATASSTGAGDGPSTTGPNCPGAPFRVDVPNAWLDDVVATPDRIVAVGWTEGQGGRLFAFDPCDGTMADERTVQFDGQTGTRLRAVGWVDDVLLAAGDTPTANDPRQGLYLRVVPDTLQSQWEVPLHGSSGEDLLGDFAGVGGRMFLVGYTTPAEMRPWLVTADTAGGACGFPWTPNGGASGEVRAVTIWQDKALAAGHAAGGHLLRYALDCACPCTPEAEYPLSLGFGEDDVLVNGLATFGNQILGAGVYWTGGNQTNLEAFLVAVSPLSGVVSATWTLDPTPTGDGFLAVDVGDGFVVAAGGKGWDGVSQAFVGADAWATAFTVPLSNGASPAWSFEPGGVDVLTAVDVDEARGAVYFVGLAGGEGVLMACTSDGTCPP
ncbi:MAG: hypothetical protein D6705_11100 [Deltaproteobacteria bacterium]|nr:MAG: hypothetical protein D6705_11100 [Deltaproteobacteria bacterium]